MEPLRFGLGGAGVAGLGLRGALPPAVIKAELDGIVAISVLGLDLHDVARPGLDDGDGVDRPGLVVDLRHPQLLPEQPVCHQFLP
jgi:hypothetical protein